MTDWTSRLAIISDEADDSFAEAVAHCLPLGIRAYELRKLEGGRFPQVTERAVQEVIDNRRRARPRPHRRQSRLLQGTAGSRRHRAYL